MGDVPGADSASGQHLVELLRELLAQLDSPKTDGIAVDRTSEQLSRVLDEIRANGDADEAPMMDPEERNRLHGALEHAMRLNAIARQLVGKRLEVIDAQLQLMRTARRALEPDGEPDAGEWCDIDG